MFQQMSDAWREAAERVRSAFPGAVRGRWRTAIVVVHGGGGDYPVECRMFGTPPGTHVAPTPAFADACRELAECLGFTGETWRFCIDAALYRRDHIGVNVPLRGTLLHHDFSDALSRLANSAQPRALRGAGPGRHEPEDAETILRCTDQAVDVNPLAFEAIADSIRRRSRRYAASGIGVVSLGPYDYPLEPRADELEFWTRVRSQPVEHIELRLRRHIASSAGRQPVVYCFGHDFGPKSGSRFSVACRTGASREAVEFVQDTLHARGVLWDVYVLVLTHADGSLHWRATFDGEAALRFQHVTEHTRFLAWRRESKGGARRGHASAVESASSDTGATGPPNGPRAFAQPLPTGDGCVRLIGTGKVRHRARGNDASNSGAATTERTLDVVRLGNYARLEIRTPPDPRPIIAYVNRRLFSRSIGQAGTLYHTATRGRGSTTRTVVVKKRGTRRQGYPKVHLQFITRLGRNDIDIECERVALLRSIEESPPSV